MIESVVEVKNLKKSYGKVEALKGISFEIKGGEVFTLIGPNGAGKTTALEIIEGLRKKDSGEVRVFGMDVAKGLSKIKPRIGVQLQHGALYEYLTVREIFILFASFYKKKKNIEKLIEKGALGKITRVRTEALSGGQLQRLRIVTTLVNDPELLFLDEPTTGLDPQSRRYIWAMIEDLREESRTILLTTHYMEEAERLADRVAIIDEGEMLSIGKPEELIAKHGGEAVMYIETEEKVKNKDLEKTEKGYRIKLKNVGAEAPRVLTDLSRERVGIKHVEIKNPSLEDVFLNLTGKELRD
ncbi:Linearmycin resistance ATP-binding protein LnrL [subsurface metagenome]